MARRVMAVPGPGAESSETIVAIEPSPKRIRVFFANEVIADSSRVQVLHETNLLPVYYFPTADVQMGRLVALERTTTCPHKGRARYWTVKVGSCQAENAVWGYPEQIAGCPDISNLVAFDWNKMDAWYEEDEEVFVHPRSPYHHLDVLESSRHVEVKFDGVTVADSRRPLLLFETGLPVRYYLPKLDVRTEFLRPSDNTTRCPYKGRASYWSVEVNGTLHRDAVWYYPTTIPENPRIAERLCFFNEKVDLYVDGELQARPRTKWS